MSQTEITATIATIALIVFAVGKFYASRQGTDLFANKSEVLCFFSAPFWLGSWTSAFVNGLQKNPSVLQSNFEFIIGGVFLISLVSSMAQKPLKPFNNSQGK